MRKIISILAIAMAMSLTVPSNAWSATDAEAERAWRESGWAAKEAEARRRMNNRQDMRTQEQKNEELREIRRQQLRQEQRAKSAR
jgi:hypothetical protein